MKVLSLGSLNLDYKYQVPHILRPGETLSARNLEVHFGGKGLNQSVALQRGGAAVWMAGRIGNDGICLKEYLQAQGIHTDYLAVDPEEKTGHAIIQVEDGSAQNCILIHGGTNGRIAESFISQVAEQFEAGDFAVFQNEISNVAYAIQTCKKHGMHIAFNPSPISEDLIHSDVYRFVDELFINETEGSQLSGEQEPEKICRTLQKKWPQCRIILTLGAEGAMVLDRGEVIRQDAYPCQAVDTTGAGDTFTGFFLAALMRGESCRRALELASKASSLAVRKSGAAESIPTLQDVLDFH